MLNKSALLTKNNSCPICSSEVKLWRNKKVDNEEYSIDLCEGCGYAFVNPRPTLKFLADYYSSYGHRHSSVESITPRLEAILLQEQNDPNSTLDAKRIIATIKEMLKCDDQKKRRLLDVGCGYGFFSKEAINSNFEVTALELAEGERIIAKEMTTLSPIASTFEEFESDSKYFDVILMSQILEHALDINLWIEKSREILVDNGILAIALPNFGSISRLIMQENEPYICPPAHLNYFSYKSLAKLLERHGLIVEKVQYVSRIPKNSFDRRMPKYGKAFLPLIYNSAFLLSKIVDKCGFGIMLNVYARKAN